MKSRTALLLLAATGCFVAGCSGSKSTGTESTGSVRVTLKRMQSCADLEATLKADARAKMNRQIDAMIESVRRGYASGGIAKDGGARGEEVSTGAPGSATPLPASPPGDSSASGPTSGGASSATSRSDTNTQVQGVDEADIVENDGKNIYLLHGQSFTILNAFPASTLAQTASLQIEGEPTEMFVDSGRAVVYSRVDGTPIYAAANVTPRAEYSDGYAYASAGRPAVDMAPSPGGGGYYTQHPLTKITVLELQAGAPTVAREVYFEGSYLSARRVNKQVRTVLTGGAHGPSLRYYPEYSDSPSGTRPAYPKNEAEFVAMYEQLRAENNAKIDATRAADWLPYTMTRENGQVVATTQRCEDLWVPPSATTEYGLTRVTAIDLDAPTAAPTGQAILGAVDTVYANAGSLYLAARQWRDPWNSVFATGVASSGGATATPGTAVSPPSGPSSPPTEPVPAPGTRSGSSGSSRPQTTPVFAPDTVVTVNYTHLHKFDLTANDPVYVASGTIPGSIKNQFSMDERNNILRVATTEDRAVLNPSTSTSDPSPRSSGPMRANNVFALSQLGDELKKTGEIRGLGESESIFSVRFVGRYAYIVTFLQTDPLFVIDMENPAAPKLLGHLEIPGFSTYMHPLDEGHLLTIGRDATNTGRQQGLALQIFDVTVPTTPKLVQKFVFSGQEYGFSEAQENHKAFTYFADKKLLAFPYVAHGSSTMRSSLEVFNIDIAAGITRRGSIDHTSLFPSGAMNGYCGGYYGPSVRRGVFMDDIVYSISYAGVIASDINNLTTPVKSIALPQPVIQGYPGCGVGGGPVPEGDVPPTPGTGTR